LARLAAHSRGATEALFLRHLGSVRRCIHTWARRCGLLTHADDAQQDAVFALHAAIHHYHASPTGARAGKVTTYLHTLLRNRFCDFCRRFWRSERHRDHAVTAGVLEAGVAADYSDPLRRAQRRETQAAVSRAVSSLTLFERWLCHEVAA